MAVLVVLGCRAVRSDLAIHSDRRLEGSVVYGFSSDGLVLDRRLALEGALSDDVGGVYWRSRVTWRQVVRWCGLPVRLLWEAGDERAWLVWGPYGVCALRQLPYGEIVENQVWKAPEYGVLQDAAGTPDGLAVVVKFPAPIVVSLTVPGSWDSSGPGGRWKVMISDPSPPDYEGNYYGVGGLVDVFDATTTSAPSLVSYDGARLVLRMSPKPRRHLRPLIEAIEIRYETSDSEPR